MGNIQHFIEYSHIGHDRVHAAVIFAGKQVFGDILKYKKGLLGGKPVLNQKCNDSVHPLTIAHVRIIQSENS